MSEIHPRSVMDQHIFTTDLSVESVSMYLLCCGLVDGGAQLNTRNLADRWNGGAERMEASLAELEDRCILKRIVSDMQGKTAYQVNPAHLWRSSR